VADVLVSPTAPTTAFKLGEKLDDPLAMYLNDVATIPANLAGIPGMSLPSGLATEDGLPTGFQILAPAMKDERLYAVGSALERELVSRWGGPCWRRRQPWRPWARRWLDERAHE
jgi:aspartyl-tRNA(Asn)/glutamyl-tRNA(Gln) amidotransferase subunit A